MRKVAAPFSFGVSFLFVRASRRVKRFYIFIIYEFVLNIFAELFDCFITLF